MTSFVLRGGCVFGSPLFFAVGRLLLPSFPMPPTMESSASADMALDANKRTMARVYTLLP